MLVIPAVSQGVKQLMPCWHKQGANSFAFCCRLEFNGKNIFQFSCVNSSSKGNIPVVFAHGSVPCRYHEHKWLDFSSVVLCWYENPEKGVELCSGFE